tara:strand:+ start:592 stop:1110 length:519 start_codon:yes stop_codon:yes gene_type:complete
MRFDTNLYEERQRWIQNLCESIPQAGFNQLYLQQQIGRATAQALKQGSIGAETHAMLRGIDFGEGGKGVHARSEALRPAREALRTRGAAAYRAKNIASSLRAARLARAGMYAKGGLAGLAYGAAAEGGLLVGGLIGNTDVVQDAAGGVGEWWANTMPSWMGGVDTYGLPQGP